MRSRRVLLLLVAVVVGGAWLALVPHDGQSADAQSPAYWWLAIGAAVGLGAATRSNDSALVGAAVALPALLLAGWDGTASDNNDGL